MNSRVTASETDAIKAQLLPRALDEKFGKAISEMLLARSKWLSAEVERLHAKGYADDQITVQHFFASTFRRNETFVLVDGEPWAFWTYPIGRGETDQET